MRRPHLALVPLLAVLVAAVGPAAARAAGCPQHTGEFARTGGSVLWPGKVKGKNVLYGCTAFYDQRPKSFKLGPWNKASQASFDGQTVAWTVKKPGTREDAIWIADVSRGYVWMRGLRPTTGRGSSTDVKVSRLLATGEGAAWVTTRGTLVMAISSPQERPEPVGETTPAATPTPAVSPTTGAPQGLLVPLKPKGRRVVVGRWESVAGDDFADTLSLEVGQGEGDECGGVNPYDATVEPVDGQRVGASWWAYWSSTSDVCS